MDLVRDPYSGKMVDRRTGLPVDEMAAGNVAPARVNFMDRLLAGSGVSERIMAAHQLFNPVTALAEAGQQSQIMLDPNTNPMGRVAALGGMLTGMAGTVAPMWAASKGAVPTANAMVDAMSGISLPGGEFLADEFGGVKMPGGGIPAYHGSPRQFDIFEIGKPSSSGVKSPAVWFSDSENVARGYGPNMTKARIDIEDGLEFDFGGKSTVFFDGQHRTPSELAKRIAEINDDLRAGYGLPEGHESDLIYDMMDAGWPEVGGPEAVSGLTLRNVDDSMSMFGGEVSTNYAVLDPRLIEIVKKYGVAGAAAMLGVTAADIEAAFAGQQE